MLFRSETDELIIIKTDIKSKDLIHTFVQYQVYHPYDLIPLDLSVCDTVKININVPIKLDESVSTLYDYMKDRGYNFLMKVIHFIQIYAQLIHHKMGQI